MPRILRRRSRRMDHRLLRIKMEKKLYLVQKVSSLKLPKKTRTKISTMIATITLRKNELRCSNHPPMPNLFVCKCCRNLRAKLNSLPV